MIAGNRSSELEISVIVCTKGNPTILRDSVSSILRHSTMPIELIVCNQGSTTEVERSLAELRNDSRLRIIHSDTRGLSSARNVGASAAIGQYLFFTDDDCVVEADWLPAMYDCMSKYPRAGVVFGRVVAPPHDSRLFAIPAYEPPQGGAEWTQLNSGPIGANMAIRRQVFDVVQGFDSIFGPGAPFSSCDEYDFVARVCMSNQTIAVDPRPTVIHAHGHRNAAQKRRMWARDGYSNGALIAKHLRIGNVLFVRHLLARFAAFPYYSVTNALHKRPSVQPGLIGIFYLSLLRGLAAGMRVPLSAGSHYQSGWEERLPVSIEDRT